MSAGVGMRPALGRVSGPRFLHDFSILTPGGATLPDGWAVSRASGLAVRNGASALIEGIANNVAGIEDDGLGNVGVLMEPADGNALAAALSSGFALAGSVADGSLYPGGTYTDPAGGTAAERTVVPSGGFTRYASRSVTTSQGATFSGWFRATSGTDDPQINMNALGLDNAKCVTVGTSWTWIACSTPNNYSLSSVVVLPGDGRDKSSGGGTTAHAFDVIVSRLMLSTLPGRTSYVAPGASRAGPRFYNSDLARFVSGGRMRLEIGLAMLWDYSQIASARTLLQIDSSNKITLTPVSSSSTPTGLTVAITVGGSVYTCPTPLRAWMGDAVTVYLEMGNGVSVFWFRLGSGDWILAGQSAASFGSLASSGSLDLCCAGTSSQLPAIVSYVRGW